MHLKMDQSKKRKEKYNTYIFSRAVEFVKRPGGTLVTLVFRRNRVLSFGRLANVPSGYVVK